MQSGDENFGRKGEEGGFKSKSGKDKLLGGHKNRNTVQSYDTIGVLYGVTLTCGYISL